MNAVQRDIHGSPMLPDAMEADVQEVPCNLAAEQAILGAIFINNEALDILRVPLEASHFYEPIHREIFDAAISLHAAGRNVNPVTIKAYVSADMIGKLTVSQYLASLVSNAVTVLNAPDYARAIMDAAARRACIALSQKMERTAFSKELDIMDEFDALKAKFEDVVKALQGGEGGEQKRPGDAYLDFFNSTSLNGGTIGVHIAIPAIRKAIGEDVFAAGNIYGLLGASGEGKTATTMQLIYGALLAGHPVQFLSYDQSASQCVRQMIAQVHSIDTKQQNDPDRLMTQNERDKCMLFVEWLNHQPFEIIRCRREGITRLLAYAKRFIKRRKNGKTPLIVIDHILKIKPRDERASPDIRSSEINMEAKAFADETQSAVLMLNQRNGQGGYRLNPRPIGKDLYGGEGAKQDYDAVAYVYRPQHWREEMLATAADEKDRIKINAVFSEFGANVDELAEFGSLKARFGPRGIREWEKFEGRYTRFCPLVPEREKELF
jgi:replicative DNA helicase